MSDKLSIETVIEKGVADIKLSGQIDEDSDFATITNIGCHTLNFNFDKVTLINSCGVREWINYIEGIEENAKIIYHNCPQIVIEQINMVHGFIKKGTKVESFYAPYYSEDDDDVVKILLRTDEIVGGKAPEKKSESGEELEFDAIEAQYFQFISQMDS